jgi:hypothetical protein
MLTPHVVMQSAEDAFYSEVYLCYRYYDVGRSGVRALLAAAVLGVGGRPFPRRPT